MITATTLQNYKEAKYEIEKSVARDIADYIRHKDNIKDFEIYCVFADERKQLSCIKSKPSWGRPIWLIQFEESTIGSYIIGDDGFPVVKLKSFLDDL